MEVRNLITFLKIIETGSFSKAAEQLTYSQSTVTVQIQQLEEEIGVQLFDRIGKKIYVTEKGHELEAYAQQIIASYEMPNDHLPGNACEESEEIAAYVDKVSQHGTVPLNDFLVPYHFSTKQSAGSTDVGDVSWLDPTAQINTVTFPSKAPGHSWQNVSCGRTSIGHKGLLTAGKVLAATAIDLFEQPQLLEQAKEEFSKRTVGGYFCPVPEDAVPTVVGGQF